MPRLAELQKQIKHSNRPLVRMASEEVLIADERAQMRPGDFVEQKLQFALRSDLAPREPVRARFAKAADLRRTHN